VMSRPNYRHALTADADNPRTTKEIPHALQLRIIHGCKPCGCYSSTDANFKYLHTYAMFHLTSSDTGLSILMMGLIDGAVRIDLCVRYALLMVDADVGLNKSR